MSEARPSISRLIQDVRSSFGALALAEIGVFQSEMHQKLARIIDSGLWLAAAALLLVSAFAVALAAIVLFMISMGVEAHLAAALVAGVLVACGLLALLRGLALLKHMKLTPERTLSHIRADLALFSRGASHE